MAERGNRRTGALIAVALVVVGLGGGLLVSRPLPKYLTTGVPYTAAAEPGERVVEMHPGDHLQYLYHLGQLRLAIEGRARWFRNTFEFAGPYGFKEFYVYFPTALVYWPLSYVGEAFAFNSIILLSFVGAMVAGYGLARAWGAGRGGAFCAGVVVALFPARLASLYGGQPAGSAFFLFPMAWWGLEKSWQTRRAGWGWLAAACLVLLARLDPHYLFFFSLLLPFWAFWKLAEAGTFATHESASSPREKHLVDALPAIVAALIAAGCVHYNQIRLHVIDGSGPEIIALAAFFILIVLAMRWLIARVVDWLGVSNESFRRLWLVVPWLALWLLAFYFLAGAIDQEKYGTRLLRACVVMFILAHIVFLAVAASKKLLRPGRIKLPWRHIVSMWPVALGLLVAVAYEMYLKTAVFDVSGVKGGRTLHEVRLHSVPFKELFAKMPGNGDFVGWALPLVVILGAVVAAATRNTSADRDTRRRFWISAALFGLGVVLTCGPLLSAYFPLYETLYRLVPFFDFTRATTKYAILTATFGGAAVALAVTFWTRATGRTTRLGAHLIWVAVLVGLVAGDHTRLIRVGISRLPSKSAVYAHVAEQSLGAPLVEIPIWPGDSAHSAVYQYWTLRTRVPTVNGYSPTVPAGYIEHISWPLYDLNYGRFGPREAAVCKELGVRLINFHEEVFPRKVSEFPPTQSLKMLRLNPNLRLVAEDGPIHLFQILDEPPTRLDADQLPFLSRYLPIDYLKRQVGKEVADDAALDGRAWASDGRRGQLFFGPFAVLPTGDYVAVFRIKAHAANATDEIGLLDVYVKRDKTPPPDKALAEMKLTGTDWQDADGYRFVEIPFTLEGTQVVETRGWFDGTPRSSLALDYVFIHSKPTSETIRIEAEEMFHAAATLVEDAAASQGLLLKFEEPPPETSHRLEERFLLLDAGAYRLRWHGSGGVAEVRRVTADGSEPVASAFISRNENGVLGTALNRFDVPQRGVYTVGIIGRLDRADYIEVAPAEPSDSREDPTRSTTPTATARSRRGD